VLQRPVLPRNLRFTDLKGAECRIKITLTFALFCVRGDVILRQLTFFPPRQLRTRNLNLIAPPRARVSAGLLSLGTQLIHTKPSAEAMQHDEAAPKKSNINLFTPGADMPF